MIALVLAACSAEPTTPGEGTNLPFGPAQSGGNGAPGSLTTLIGEWERFEIDPLEGDIVTTTVHWLFNANGSCIRAITTFSANEGFPRTQLSECTWNLGPATITLRFTGDEQATFALSFPGFDPDRMLLDGFEYHRVR